MRCRRLIRWVPPAALTAALLSIPAGAGADQQWLPPTSLSGSGQNASQARVGLDDRGNAVAAWTRFDGADPDDPNDPSDSFCCDRIQAAVAAPGAGFGPAQTLSDPGQSASEPQLAVDPNGNAVAVWTRFNGTKLVIQAAARAPGGSFGPPQTISDPAQEAFGPQVSIDAAGNATAIWSRFDGTKYRAQVASRPVGGSFGAVQTLSAAGQDAFETEIDLSPDGHAVATWTRSDGSTLRIQAAARAAVGSFAPPQTISSIGFDSFVSQVGVSPGGNAVAVWYALQGSKLRVQSAPRPAGGSFGTPQTLSDTSQDAFDPQVDVDSGGNAVAVWNRFDGADPDDPNDPNDPACCNRVQAAARPAGGGFGPVSTISAAGQHALRPRVALDPGGNATAVWYRFNGAAEVVQAAARPAGGSFGVAETISQPGQNAFEPEVDASTTNAVAVWYRFDGSVASPLCCARAQASAREPYDAPERAVRLNAELVPAYRATLSSTQCAATGRAPSTHGAPLAFGSCNPPAASPGVSAFFGARTNAGFNYLLLRGDGEPGNGVDADLVIVGSATDIRSSTGADYDPSPVHDLTLATSLRLTDHANTSPGRPCVPAGCHGTTVDFDLAGPINCVGNFDAATGSTCNLNTSVNGLTPGAIEDGSQSVMQLSRVRLKDAGPNGVGGDADDRLFALQGLYVP
jgi:hypothetical protein